MDGIREVAEATSRQYVPGRDSLVACKRLNFGDCFVDRDEAIPQQVLGRLTPGQIEQFIRVHHFMVAFGVSADTVNAAKPGPSNPTPPEAPKQRPDPLTCYICDPPRSFPKQVNKGKHDAAHKRKGEL